jgi:hypothetical protein
LKQIYTGAGRVIALCTGRPGITFSVNKRTLRSKTGLLSISYVVLVAFLLTLCVTQPIMKLSDYGDEGRVFNSSWVYGLLSHLSCLHRRPFHTDFMQFLSGVKVYIGPILKVTEQNRPVATFIYMHLDIQDVVL